ncbi:MAG: amino acid ABC transporter permease [Candidatus Nanopelagicaceae bacterium]|jgi:His/Glu/Gln/Arg/opine family amino acid ABC transporter permease subunit
MDGYQYNWSVVWESLPELRQGLIITLQVSIVGMSLAIVFGLLCAIGRLSQYGYIRKLSVVVIDFSRSIPLFVLLFWVYYGLSLKFSINLTAFQAGAIALGITGGAYMAEVFRGGINAIDLGQREAALAIGLTQAKAFNLIVLPQAIRIIIPQAVNVYVGLLKGATIVSVIGVADMIYVAQYISLNSFTPFEMYSAVGIAFIAMTISIAGLAFLLEARLNKGRTRG